jgi:hypothetical protein
MGAFCENGGGFVSRFKDPAVVDKRLFSAKFTNFS